LKNQPLGPKDSQFEEYEEELFAQKAADELFRPKNQNKSLANMKNTGLGRKSSMFLGVNYYEALKVARSNSSLHDDSDDRSLMKVNSDNQRIFGGSKDQGGSF
jgi:hypothetical protein